MAAPLKGFPGLKLTVDNVDLLRKQMMVLVNKEVLVGVPEDATVRPEDPEAPQGITNAALAYIHDNGAPEQNIPARPFMIPGMKEAEGKVTQHLTWAAKQVLQSKQALPGAVDVGFERAGIAAQLSIQRKINEGIPPPLADATLRRRVVRKGPEKEMARRAAGEAPSTLYAKPLIDTGEMRKSIKYVIRPRRNRSK